jgi:drug/metabolite transporter (DMT)-like permease
VTALLAVVLIHERLTAADWYAVGAITIGLAMLAVASGDIGDDDPPDGFMLGLSAGIVAVLLLGLVVLRSHGRYAASALGVLAGLGFAGSGLAARVLPGLTPADLWGSPATYALPIYGALAYGLYSFALRRGSVTEATGPMIVFQTVTPAVVGVALLGDEVRDGWAPVAVVGFVLTAVGAVALARFEGGVRGPTKRVEGRASERAGDES